MIHGRGSWCQLLIYQFHNIKGFTPAPTHQEPSFQFRLPSQTRHIHNSQGAKDSSEKKPLGSPTRVYKPKEKPLTILAPFLKIQLNKKLLSRFLCQCQDALWLIHKPAHLGL